MSTAKKFQKAEDVIKEAIKKDGAIRIFLTTSNKMDGCFPVQIEFEGNTFRIKKTSHHDGVIDELELVVDYGRSPHKVAWVADKPDDLVKVEQVLQDTDLWLHHFRVYGFLDSHVIPTWDDPRILKIKDDKLAIPKAKPAHIMSEC